MSDIRIEIGTLKFIGRWQTTAPLSRAWLLNKLPLEGSLMQARWSGEAGWCRLGADAHIDPENATSQPGPGQILIYGGPVSEPELLIPYGICAFAYQGGPLRGNHVATIEPVPRALHALGELLQSKGAQSLRITPG